MQRSLAWILSCTSLVALASLQVLSDRTSDSRLEDTRQAVLKNEQVLLPDSKLLGLLSLNQREFLADLLWLQTIQYFGTGNPYQVFPALGGYTERVTTLDPQYAYPAQFALVGLPFMGQTDTAVRIGERALQALPNDPLITFYLATVYHLHVKDYARAAELYARASKIPGSPTAAASLASIAASQVSEQPSDRLAAISLWQEAYQTANSDEERERAERWIGHLEIVYSVEMAAYTYKERTGSYPSNLASMGIIEPITTPLDTELTYSAETGRVSWQQ